MCERENHIFFFPSLDLFAESFPPVSHMGLIFPTLGLHYLCTLGIILFFPLPHFPDWQNDSVKMSRKLIVSDIKTCTEV